jgi:hypothetical protein
MAGSEHAKMVFRVVPRGGGRGAEVVGQIGSKQRIMKRCEREQREYNKVQY